MAAELMEYPDYYKTDKLASYLRRAQAVNVPPIFTNILSSRDLSVDDKNIFINMYCALVPDFMRQMRGSHDHPHHDPSASREIESVSSESDGSEYVRDRFGTLPGESTLVAKGGKTRRKSRRKSRR